MKKALSEIVVVVMVLMVTAALAGAAFVFMRGLQEENASGIVQSNEQAVKSLGSCLKVVSFDSATNSLLVKNCGKYAVDNISVFIDNGYAFSERVDMKPNEKKNIAISASAGIREIRLVSEYVSAETSVKIGDVCTDGTPYGQCSDTQPKYCDAGTLVNRCSACGCSSGSCQPDGSCATFGFSLSASPSSGTVTQGSPATTSVTATLVSGTAQSVTFSCSAPPGINGITCSSLSLTPTDSGGLTVSTTAATQAGTHTITISGTGGGVTEITTYGLTVTAPLDTTSPSTITLAAGNPSSASIDLTWVAPGDDGNTGTASSYDIRYSTTSITAANWASATQVTGEPAPRTAGSAESFKVTGLSPSTAYYFAINSSDEVPNWSGISNSPSMTTLDYKMVFVTSQSTNGDFGGLSEGDGLCQALADAAGLPGTFIAWLSQDLTGNDPRARMVHSTVPYKRTDGTTVANDWTDLTTHNGGGITDDFLRAPISKDEYGNTVTDTVYTNTGTGGWNLGIPQCGGWTRWDLSAYVGSSSSMKRAWTDSSFESCNVPRRLYCFEQ